jgi:hypothetical protein
MTVAVPYFKVLFIEFLPAGKNTPAAAATAAAVCAFYFYPFFIDIYTVSTIIE